MEKETKEITVVNSFRDRVGDGFEIRRPLPNAIANSIGPFLLLDHSGPTRIEPSDTAKGVGEHPHRGFETVTLVFQGAITHKDSAGNQGTIFEDGVQWMTAASGVVHEEMHGEEFTRKGGTIEIIQLWVNLPRKHKMDPPKYQEIHAEAIPAIKEDHVVIRVIAGELSGVQGPANTHTPLQLLDLRFQAKGAWAYEGPSGYETAVYVRTGTLNVNGQKMEEGQMAIINVNSVNMESVYTSNAVIISGEPINEPITSYGPFVMNYPADIKQAILDYNTGKMGSLKAAVFKK